MKILIKNPIILTMTGEELTEGNIYIDGNRIVKIGQDPDFVADKVIEGEGKLAMPGLINSHTHVGMSFFRNYSDDVNLETWLNEKIWPLEAKLTAEDVYRSSLLSMCEMIMTGTTTFADMYYFEDQTIKALKKSGMRAQLSRGLTLPDDGDEKLKEGLDLFEKYEGALDGRVHVALAPHAVYTTDKDYLKKIASLSQEKNIPIHTHLSETATENSDCLERFGQSPAEVYLECGVFDEKSILAHGVHLTDSDLEKLSKKDVSIAHNPSSNLKLSSGFLDVSRAKKAGINVALGTDSSSSNNNLSMFKEISLASLVSKYRDPKNLSAYEILEMATINGAKALGLEEDLGTLEEGKLADIILIDIDNVNHCPKNNLISSLCYSTYDRDVKDVLIDGRLVYEDGAFVDLDSKEIMAKSEESFEKLKAR